MIRPILVCLDRDGTINKDENYYLGSADNWREQVEFLPGVIEGIQHLNRVRGLELCITTNQSGVALMGEQFDKLDLMRMLEVNEYIIELLTEKRAFVAGYVACPYVDLKYAKKAEARERKVNPEFIQDDCPDLKPRTGMILKAMKLLGLKAGECDIFTIGDRASDVEMGINAGGHGILVPGYKTKESDEDVARVNALWEKYPGKAHIAEDFLQVAWLIGSGEWRK